MLKDQELGRFICKVSDLELRTAVSADRGLCDFLQGFQLIITAFKSFYFEKGMNRIIPSSYVF
jgi:hypothetical protein